MGRSSTCIAYSTRIIMAKDQVKVVYPGSSHDKKPQWWSSFKLRVWVPTEEVDVVMDGEKKMREDLSIKSITTQPNEEQLAWSEIDILGEAGSAFEAANKIEKAVDEIDDVVAEFRLPSSHQHAVTKESMLVKRISADTSVRIYIPDLDNKEDELKDVQLEGELQAVATAFQAMSVSLVQKAPPLTESNKENSANANAENGATADAQTGEKAGRGRYGRDSTTAREKAEERVDIPPEKVGIFVGNSKVKLEVMRKLRVTLVLEKAQQPSQASTADATKGEREAEHHLHITGYKENVEAASRVVKKVLNDEPLAEALAPEESLFSHKDKSGRGPGGGRGGRMNRMGDRDRDRDGNRGRRGEGEGRGGYGRPPSGQNGRHWNRKTNSHSEHRASSYGSHSRGHSGERGGGYRGEDAGDRPGSRDRERGERRERNDHDGAFGRSRSGQGGSRNDDRRPSRRKEWKAAPPVTPLGDLERKTEA